MGFNQRWVDSIPYMGDGEATDFHWDGCIGGFGLAVYPSGNKSYILKYRFHGKQRVRSLGRTTILSLNEAKQKALAQ